MSKILTKEDFVQVDSTWLYVIGNFHLSLSQNDEGKFKLSVFGSLEPIPAATAYPSEPEWERTLMLANEFLAVYREIDNSQNLPETLTKDTFRQIDSEWIYILGNIHLNISRNGNDTFRLNVYGLLDPVPDATAYPTTSEWDRALELANKFKTAYIVALDRDKLS